MAKESCIAWLPRIIDAATIDHLKLADRSPFVGASIAACRSATDSRTRNPDAGKKATAAV
jgi:hypothetical protein